MKRKEINDLKGKSLEELKKLVEETRTFIVKSKMEIKTAKLKNVKIIKNKRADLARMLTFIRQKEAKGEVK